MKDLPIFKVIYKHTTFTGYIKYVKLCWNLIQYKEVLKGIIGGKLIKKITNNNTTQSKILGSSLPTSQIQRGRDENKHDTRRAR